MKTSKIKLAESPYVKISDLNKEEIMALSRLNSLDNYIIFYSGDDFGKSNSKLFIGSCKNSDNFLSKAYLERKCITNIKLNGKKKVVTKNTNKWNDWYNISEIDNLLSNITSEGDTQTVLIPEFVYKNYLELIMNFKNINKRLLACVKFISTKNVGNKPVYHFYFNDTNDKNPVELYYFNANNTMLKFNRQCFDLLSSDYIQSVADVITKSEYKKENNTIKLYENERLYNII